MRLKPFLLTLLVLALPAACERNRTTVVKTTPTQQPIESRAQPVEPVEPQQNVEEDMNNNLPEQTPTEETRDEDTGINGGKTTPNIEPSIEPGIEEEPVTPPR